ncbi:MAG: hypothetical protein Q7S40_30195 [Opitutaceae bacterium]|nr:hypothetical protein [Opitutaceae bacterium]
MKTKLPSVLSGRAACHQITVSAALALLFSGAYGQVARGPQPGDVYREFASYQGGDDWRVTNPQAETERARRHLPNPVLAFAIDTLDAAVRAEAMLERWSGHVQTKRPQIRFNGNGWLDVPPPLVPPGPGEHEAHYFQDNPVLAVPLEHLKKGQNTFEGTTSHANPKGWGQWGLYSMILRVYYDPAKRPHPTGRIVAPADGATIGENPRIDVDANSVQGVARVDILAWYEGYDENGDGVWLDWHGGNFQAIRGRPAELREHVGTAWRAPYQLTWDTRWVPDQQPRAIKLVARIQDSGGNWSVTPAVANLTLRREGESVRLFRAGELPLRFGVRAKQAKSCPIPIPREFDPGKVIEAGLHLRTWHGYDGHHHPFRFNDYTQPNGGKNHHFDYDIHPIPPSALRAGENTFTISSDTDQHMLEVHWPGPALTVRYRAAGR